MANKQKHPQKGPFKKSQSEKSQRNVNIIKHFHPNVQFNRYHLNCDIPEINADVETKEHFFQPKKHPIISKAIVNKAAPKSLSTKDEKNTVVKKVESYHMTKAVSSKIKVSIPSGSSSSTDYDVSPKYINSVNSLIIPNIRPSTSSSTSPSRANSTINKRNYQTKKAKTFSVNNKNKKKIIVSLRGNNESDEISSNNILNTRRNLISDLKQEIIDNQLRTPLPYLRKNNAIKSPNDDKVEHLREEIKNLINTNLLNKRKHLAEIKAEISNHQGTGDVLVYNVNIENSTNKSKDQREIENIPSNDNATIETTENIQQVRCSRRIERKPKSQSGSISRTLGQENDREANCQRRRSGTRAARIPNPNALSACPPAATTPHSLLDVMANGDLLLDGGGEARAVPRAISTRVCLVVGFATSLFSRPAAMDYDTRLIAEIERRPELYDQAHRDFKNKDAKKKVWAAITYNLRGQVDAHAVKTVKMRWKSLRDSYVKETRHKMAISSGQDLRPRKNWRYSHAMSFLAPHLAISFPVHQVKDISDESEDLHDDDTVTPSYFLNLHPEATDEGHFLGALLDLSKNQMKSQLDQSRGQPNPSRQHLDPDVGVVRGPAESDVESFFRGLADTVKKLSAVNQIRVQRDIVNIVLDAKLREVQEK